MTTDRRDINMKVHQILIVLAFLSVGFVPLAQAEPAGPVPDPVAVRPFLDVPMQSPSICRTPGGGYLLTGTVASEPPDFQNNDGIWLWKSEDLEDWEAIGQVWSIERDAADSSWQARKRPGRVSGRPVRGMVSPEICYIKDNYYITYSMNGWGCGLLESTTGEPEGPYRDIGRVTPEGEALSLFEDDDGAVYAAFDEGWVARMKDDMSGLAESPRLVMPRSGSDLGNAPFRVGRKGVFLFKRGGVYYLACAEWTGRTGRAVYDSFVASAEDLYGPYDCRHLMCGNGGQTTLFSDGDGQWYCTMSGSDVQAKFRDRPAVVPLEWVDYELYWTRGVRNEFPSKPHHIITERGPWHECRPLTDDIIRDVHAIRHDDGYVYYTGSCLSDRYHDQVVLWRFKADDAAKVGRGEMRAETMVAMHFKDLGWLDYENRLKHGKGKWGYGLVKCCMDADVFFLKGTFYMTFNLYRGGELGEKHTLDGGETFTHGSGVIRSTSGTWEGPWESVGKAPYSHCKLHVDEQGRIVSNRGWRGVLALQPDGSFKVLKKPEELVRIQYPPQGMTYCDDGSAFASVRHDELLDAWKWTSTEWNGTSSLHIEGRPGSTYDTSLSWSESGKEEGPYPRCRNTIPHCGGAGYFRDSKGRFWNTFFGNDSTAPWFTRMGIIPLEVRKQGTQYRIDIADRWPED